MSETVARGREAGPQAEAGEARGSRRPGGWVAAGLVLVLAAGGAAGAWRAGVFAPAGPSGSGQPGPPAPATQAVIRENLSATTPVSATLGYAGSYPVTGQGGGTLTWLPRAGQVIGEGRALYRVGNGSPVVLLYGGVPAWRNLGEGVTGADVSQLNHDLVALGDAARPGISAAGWDYFSWETLAGGAAGDMIGAMATAGYARGHGEAVVIPPEAWAGGLAAAVVIGALAGLLPAIRAARLSPTQALVTL